MGNNKMKSDEVFQSFFIDIEEVSLLEQEEKWEEIRVLLYNKWKSNMNDLDVLIRLSTECWYVLSFWDICIDNHSLNYDIFIQNLRETYVYGLKNFSDNSKFLWIFGYMIELFPYYFGDYLELEKQAKVLIKQAYSNAPENEIIKMHYNFAFKKRRKYDHSQKKIEKDISIFFPGKSIMEEYFKEVLAKTVT